MRWVGRVAFHSTTLLEVLTSPLAKKIHLKNVSHLLTPAVSSRSKDNQGDPNSNTPSELERHVRKTNVPRRKELSVVSVCSRDNYKLCKSYRFMKQN